MLRSRKISCERMFERMTTTREGLEPIPAGLSRLEAIHWCLVPRDRRRGTGAGEGFGRAPCPGIRCKSGR